MNGPDVPTTRGPDRTDMSAAMSSPGVVAASRPTTSSRCPGTTARQDAGALTSTGVRIDTGVPRSFTSSMRARTST